jgi:hypothetical protein
MCTSTHPDAIVAKIYKDVFDTLAAHGVGSSDLFLHSAICRLRRQHVELLADITPEASPVHGHPFNKVVEITRAASKRHETVAHDQD